MVCGILMSEKGRRSAVSASLIVNIVLILWGIAMFCFSLVMLHNLKRVDYKFGGLNVGEYIVMWFSDLAAIHPWSILYPSYLMAVTGTIVIVSHLIMSVFCLRWISWHHRPHLQIIMVLYKCPIIVINVLLVTGIVATFYHMCDIEEDIMEALPRMMMNYRRVGDFKDEMDEIQTDYQCCGTNDASDWFRTPWMRDIDSLTFKDRK